jgi:hypothetical protein
MAEETPRKMITVSVKTPKDTKDIEIDEDATVAEVNLMFYHFSIPCNFCV